jgi:hypothetical protein
MNNISNLISLLSISLLEKHRLARKEKMLLSTFLTLTSLLAASASPLSARQAEIDPNQAVVDAWLADTSNTTTLVIGSAFYVKEPQEPSDKLDRRECLRERFTRNNVDRTGTWWSSWAKVSGCYYNGLNSGTASRGIQTSQTVSKTISGGFDLGLASAEDISKLINGNAGLNFGYQWTTSKTTAETFTCNINAGDKVSVWQQNLMGWSDTAQQSCVTGCGQGITCDSWRFGHIDFPLQGGSTNQNLGCSSGAASNCP